MDRLFLDANILFSAAYSALSRLRQIWTLPDTELVSSPFAVQEAHSNLARARLSQLPVLLQLLAAITLIPDPPPAAVLPGGIQLPATHLLTGDVKHFGQYFGQRLAGVLIQRPAAYLQSRQNSP